MDTIFALATAPGKAGVAIIRISGPDAKEVAQLLPDGLPKGRAPVLRHVTDLDGVRLDQALVLVFPTGASFTGEAVVELHLHGSRAIVQSVLDTLGLVAGFRLAQPGEFTRRALENGRLSLTEVEALGHLIEAETEAQRRQAQSLFDGGLRDKASGWRSALVRALALLQVGIDFADEDIPEDSSTEVSEILGNLTRELETEVTGIKVAERVREGFEVAILGAPNVGKSTLLNTLAGREAAITSDIAGTTRDIVEVRMDLNGLPVTFLDTAGIQETADVVERLGIERAIARAEQADMRVFLRRGDEPLPVRASDMDVVLQAMDDEGASHNGVSGKTGHGVERLLSRVAEVLSDRVAAVRGATTDRHRVAILNALDSLATAQSNLDQPDLASEDIRQAVNALDALVGRIDVEAVLDEVFSSFCLGK